MTGVAIEIAATLSESPDHVDPRKFPPAMTYSLDGSFTMADVECYRRAGWIIPTTYEEEVARRKAAQMEAP